jgi:hypothetical protein
MNMKPFAIRIAVIFAITLILCGCADATKAHPRSERTGEIATAISSMNESSNGKESNSLHSDGINIVDCEARSKPRKFVGVWLRGLPISQLPIDSSCFGYVFDSSLVESRQVVDLEDTDSINNIIRSSRVLFGYRSSRELQLLLQREGISTSDVLWLRATFAEARWLWEMTAPPLVDQSPFGFIELSEGIGAVNAGLSNRSVFIHIPYPFESRGNGYGLVARRPGSGTGTLLRYPLDCWTTIVYSTKEFTESSKTESFNTTAKFQDREWVLQEAK